MEWNRDIPNWQKSNAFQPAKNGENLVPKIANRRNEAGLSYSSKDVISRPSLVFSASRNDQRGADFDLHSFKPKARQSERSLAEKSLEFLSQSSFPHFIERQSCLKKPSFFFSSFRQLPYFLVERSPLKRSEKLSTKTPIFSKQVKRHGLRKTLLASFSSKDMKPGGFEIKGPLPLEKQPFIFNSNGWDSTQHKSFSIKPLSASVSREIGYKTSRIESHLTGFGPVSDSVNCPVFSSPKVGSLWKILPPLFQPLTFRFIDLNLSRTWWSPVLNKNAALPSQPSKPSWKVNQKSFWSFPLPLFFSDFFGGQQAPKKHARVSLNENDWSLLNTSGQASYTKASPYLSGSVSPNSNAIFASLVPNNQITQDVLLTGNNSTNLGSDLKIQVYNEKPLLKNRTVHGPPLKNQKESISLPNYLKNITNQNYQNLCPQNLHEFYFMVWILFTKTLFIYLSLHYLKKFITFLGTEYIRNLFKIFVTMKFIDGNILSIIKTFQDFNFQLNQQNIIDTKVNNVLKNSKRN